MISWIQRTFQHHFKSVFAILLGAVIITFIFSINASGGFGRGQTSGSVAERRFFEHDLSTADGQMAVFGDARLSVQLQLGAFAGVDSSEVQSYALQRATSLHLADLWHIPAPTTAEITEAIKQLRMFAGQDGTFDAKAYQSFQESLKKNTGGASEGDVMRVISDDIRMDKVNKLVAGPGYVLPADITSQLVRSDTTWTVATASTNYADFKVDVKPTDADLTKAFEQSGGRYDIPPRITVSYVDFPATAYLAQVMVSEPEVRAFYDANPARFPKPAPAVPTAPGATPPASDPAADYAAVRPQVETALKLDRARQFAGRQASELALALSDAKVTDPAALDALLATRKTPARPMEPFTLEAGPKEFPGARDLAEQAFRLNKDRPFSEAIETPTGAVVLFWKNLEPSRKPQFAEVRDKVLTDYVETERRKRYLELTRTVKSQLEARLKAGDTLEKAAATVTALKLETKTPAPFTLANPPQDLAPGVTDALDNLQKGQLSDLAGDQDKGVFVYAIDKKAPDLTEANPRYVEVRDRIASYTARVGGSSYLSEMMQAELERTEPKTAR